MKKNKRFNQRSKQYLNFLNNDGYSIEQITVQEAKRYILPQVKLKKIEGYKILKSGICPFIYPCSFCQKSHINKSHQVVHEWGCKEKNKVKKKNAVSNVLIDMEQNTVSKEVIDVENNTFLSEAAQK